MFHHYLIVPAWTDQAGQCRIVARAHEHRINIPLNNYRETPDLWQEAGLMSSDGRLRYLKGPVAHGLDIKSCEPLMAGTSFVYEEK